MYSRIQRKYALSAYFQPQTMAAKLARIVAAAFVLVIGVGILVFISRQNNAGQRDFISYWSAGQLLRQGGDPYDWNSVLSLEQKAGFTGNQPLIMRNPPVALFLAAPFGYVSANTASILWMLFLLAAVLLSIRLIWLTNGSPPNRNHLLGYCFAPLMSCMMLGQLGIVLLLGTALFFYLLPRRPFLAGVALLLCSIKPHLFVPFGLALLLWIMQRKAWSVLAGVATSVGVSCLLSFTLDPHAWTQYHQMVRTAGIMQQIVPTWSEMLRQAIDKNSVWLQFVPEVVACAWAVRYYRSHRAAWQWLHHGFLLLLVGVLCSPYALFTDECLLLPAVLSAVYAAERNQRSLIVFGSLAAIAMLEVMTNIPIVTVYYLWTPIAWLAWYLYATRPKSVMHAAAA